jgi:hypothetical protein
MYLAEFISRKSPEHLTRDSVFIPLYLLTKTKALQGNSLWPCTKALLKKFSIALSAKEVKFRVKRESTKELHGHPVCPPPSLPNGHTPERRIIALDQLIGMDQAMLCRKNIDRVIMTADIC